MPNIEIHGFEKETALQWLTKIAAMLNNSELAKDVVITVYKTEVYDTDLIDQPFLRICSTDEVETLLKVGKITDILEELCIDIEIQTIMRFIEAPRRWLTRRTKPQHS